MKMGINYNPSSFDTNKTILQAIEELNDAITAEDKTKVIKKYGIWA